jgi:hypothetical protein
VSLAVLVDGIAMPEDEARAFWSRFSAYMEEHKGDLAGFAKQEGFASVHPSMVGGGAALLASRTAPQKAYRSVEKAGGKEGGAGGSPDHQRVSADPPGGRRSTGKKSKRRH